MSFPDLRPVDRLHALEGLQGNPAWLHFVTSAERAYAELAISGPDFEQRESSRRFTLVLRELARRLGDELRAAREEVGAV